MGSQKEKGNHDDIRFGDEETGSIDTDINSHDLPFVHKERY